ncbi:MAG: hypothetical protein WCC17_02630 [Candidatus Nitrosopolaris sp.]
MQVSSLKVPPNLLSASAITGLEYAINSPEAFGFLKGIAEYYNIWVNNEEIQNLEATLKSGDEAISRELEYVIYRGGLVA